MSFLLGFWLIGSALASSEAFTVQGIKFVSRTNLSAITVHGEAPTQKGSAVLEGGSIQTAKIVIPVASFDTGMKLRDEHMREKIFTTSSGQTPDVEIQLDKPVSAPKGEGTLELPLKGRIRGNTASFPATCATSGSKPWVCQAKIHLADFQIEPPSHLGVKVSPDVELQFEIALSAKP